MSGCRDMKQGEIYECPDCRMTIQVLRACDPAMEEDDCCRSDEDCSLRCCGRELVSRGSTPSAGQQL